MSSRILQENTDLLLTEASEPVINENFIATNGITTGSPSLATTSISQDHNSSPANINTGPSVLATTAITQDHNLSPSSVVTSPPDLATATITQSHDLSSVSIATSSPDLATTAVTQGHNVSADSVQTNNPVVQTASVTQDHNLTVTAIVSGQVVVSNAGLVQNHSFQANSISTGSPVVPSVLATEAENFGATSIVTGTPSLGQTSLTQAHSLSASNILTPFPDVGSADDPNAIIVQEIREIEQMFGGWQRRTYEVPDGRLVQAEREIQALTGDVVSIDRKAKSLIKFGKSADLVANTLETVWTVGGNETYVTDNTIEYISSSSALDNQTIKLECHTVSGTGTDAKFTFLVQEVTLNGQTPVALTTPVARVSHAYNSNGTELVGRVTVYENTTVVGGVPSDPTKIHIDIPQGLQGSFKGATTFSDSDYYILTGGFGSVSKKQEANVDFYLEVREAGGVFIQRAAVSGSTGGPWDIELDPAVIVPKNADVRIRADSATNNAVVFGVFKGYLAKVIG